MSQEVSSNFSTLIEIGKYILPGVGGWFLKDFYDRRKRKRDISDLARGLKAEVLRIRELAIKGEGRYKILDRCDYKEWVEITNTGDDYLLFIPKNLDDFYKVNIGKLGMLDEKLIIKIRTYYGNFTDWELDYKNIIDAYYKGMVDYIAFNLDNNKKSAEWLIKTADELVVELDKKIKK